MDREQAEAHWKYTEDLLIAVGHEPTELEHFLYVEAMLHGAKHEKNDESNLDKIMHQKRYIR